MLAMILAVSAVFAGPAASDSAWQFELTPYLWGATIGGDVAAADDTRISAPAPGDSSFFSLDNLQGAAFLAFEAKRDQWRLMLDGVYIDFADDVLSGPLVTISERIKGFIVDAAVGYRVASAPQWEILGGARYFQIENDLQLKPGPRARSEKSWTDPFVGARFTHPITENWQLNLRADIGGLVSADLMQNYSLNIDYRMSERIKLRIGYRYLDTDFEKGRFEFDVSAKGPLLGVTIGF
jgi:hypothetical protein